MGDEIPVVAPGGEAPQQSGSGAAVPPAVDPDHFSASEIEAAANAGQQAAPAVNNAGRMPAPQAAAPGVVQPQAAQAAPAWYSEYGAQTRQEFDQRIGAMAQELAQYRRMAQGGQQQQPAAQGNAGGTPALRKLPQRFHEAAGLSVEEWNQRGELDQYGVFGDVHAHYIQNHPAVQAAIDARVKQALAPYEQQMGQLGQFQQQTQQEREISTVGGQAKTMMQAFIQANPELTNNPKAKAAFVAAVEADIDYVYGAVAQGRNPFTRIGGEILWQNRATLAEARGNAANQRMQQTGAGLSATPRPGMANQQLAPANKDERTFQVGREKGLSDDMIGAIIKAAKNHDM